MVSLQVGQKLKTSTILPFKFQVVKSSKKLAFVHFQPVTLMKMMMMPQQTNLYTNLDLTAQTLLAVSKCSINVIFKVDIFYFCNICR